MMKEKKFDLQDRLIDYAVRIMTLLEETNELISILFKSVDTAKRSD